MMNPSDELQKELKQKLKQKFKGTKDSSAAKQTLFGNNGANVIQDDLDKQISPDIINWIDWKWGGKYGKDYPPFWSMGINAQGIYNFSDGPHKVVWCHGPTGPTCVLVQRTGRVPSLGNKWDRIDLNKLSNGEAANLFKMWIGTLSKNAFNATVQLTKGVPKQEFQFPRPENPFMSIGTWHDQECTKMYTAMVFIKDMNGNRMVAAVCHYSGVVDCWYEKNSPVHDDQIYRLYSQYASIIVADTPIGYNLTANTPEWYTKLFQTSIKKEKVVVQDTGRRPVLNEKEKVVVQDTGRRPVLNEKEIIEKATEEALLVAARRNCFLTYCEPNIKIMLFGGCNRNRNRNRCDNGRTRRTFL